MKKIDKLLCGYIIFNIVYVFLIGFTNTMFKITQQYFSYGFIALSIINIIIFILLCRKKLYKKNILELLLILIVIFGIISTIFAYKPNIALFGITKRYEGLFTIIYYLTLFLISSFLSKKNKKIIIYSILVVSFLEIAYSLFQKIEFPGVKVIYNYNRPWASGFVINPNFLGIYALFGLSYSIGLFMDEKKDTMEIIYTLLILFFMYGLMNSNTLSVLVATFVVMILVIVYAIKNKLYAKLGIVLVSLLAMISMAHFTKQTTLIDDLVKTKNESVSMANGTAKDTKNYGTGRIYIWKKTIKKVPKHLVHGIGIDNFYYILDGKPIKRNHQYYDKAHNELLQILITEGLLCFLTYIIMYFVVVKRGIIDSFKDKQIYYILPVVGYIVQAMFSISVITVAPIFYIAMGLTIKRETLE